VANNNKVKAKSFSDGIVERADAIIKAADPHNRLHQPLAVRLRAQESGFKLIAEGHELVNPGDDAVLVIPSPLLVLFVQNQ